MLRENTDCGIILVKYLISIILLHLLTSFLSAQSAKQWVSIGDSAFAANNYQKAAQAFENAINSYKTANDKQKVIFTTVQLYLTYFYNDDDRKAIDILNEVINSTLVEFPENDSLIGDLYKFKSYFYQTASKPYKNIDSCEKYLRLSVEHFENTPFIHEIIDGYVRLAFVQQSKGKSEEMLPYLTKAESFFKKNPEFKSYNQIATIYNLFSVYYLNLGDFDKSLEYSQKAIDSGEKNQNNDPGIIDLIFKTYINMGVTYRRKGDFDRAEEYLKQSEILVNSQSSISEGSLIFIFPNLCTVYNRKRDFSRMKAYSQKHLDILDKMGSSAPAAHYILAYNNLAVANTEIGDYQEAKKYLNLALPLHKTQTRFSEQTYHNLGMAYRYQGEFQQAIPFYHKSAELYRKKEGKVNQDLGKVYRHIGVSYMNLGQLDSSLTYYQKALQVLSTDFESNDIFRNPDPKSVQAKDNLLRTWRDKAKTLRILYQETGEQKWLKESHLLHIEIMALIDLMQREFNESSKQFWAEEVIPVYEQAMEVAIEYFQISQDESILNDAFLIMEKSKAVTLLSAIRESGARKQAGIPEALFEEEERVKRDLAFYAKKVFDEKQKGGKVDSIKLNTWEQKIFQLERDKEAFITRIEKEYPAYFNLKYQNTVPQLTELQTFLSEKQSDMVEYFWGNQNLYILSVNAQKMQLKAIPVAGIETLILELRKFITNQDMISERGRDPKYFQLFITLSQRLFQSILQPVYSETPGSLIVIPDGVLNYLPFETLLTEKVENVEQVNYAKIPLLIKTTRIRYEYSTTVLFDHRTIKTRSRGLVGFAPVYETNNETRDSRSNGEYFSPLANNQPEVKNIVSITGGEKYLGERADEKTFKTISSKFKVLHLAMHAFTNDQDPLYSGMAFSQLATNELNTPTVDSTLSVRDDILYAYELYNLNLNADLAVLSACNTGIGKLSRGEGVMSLARAFKYAGVPNVVTSLWQADDHATSTIMVDFYSNLEVGMGKDEALQKAKLKFIENNWINHPFFWATFILIGDEEPLEIENGTIYLYLGILILISLIIGIWLIRRRKVGSSH